MVAEARGRRAGLIEKEIAEAQLKAAQVGTPSKARTWSYSPLTTGKEGLLLDLGNPN